MAEQLDLLIKLLKMTASSNDGEAVVAVRKANECLKRMSTDWESLLRGKVTIIEDPFTRAAPAPRQPTRSAPPPPPNAPPRAARSARTPFTTTPPSPPPPQQPLNFCAACRQSYAGHTHVCSAAPYAAKVNQPAKQRRKNPMTLDDIL